MARVPQIQEVAELLSQLTGRDVAAGSGGPVDHASPGVAATYVDDDGSVRATCLLDIAVAASLGAALTMVPVGPVDEAVSSGALSESLMDNVREVCNVMAALVSDTDGESFYLGEVLALPDGATAVGGVLAAGARLDASVDVSGYRGGAATFVAG